MKTTLRATLLAVLLVPALASAQVSLGLRAGYAFPFGDAYEQSGLGTFKQSDLAKGALPLQLDATWRFSPAVSAGVYVSYGFGQAGSRLKELCATPGSSCKDPTFIRYGAQGAYTFEAAGKLDPWLGLSVGVEQASFGVKSFVYGVIPGSPPTVLAADLDGTLRGWEAGVAGGADYRLSPSFAIGPVVSFSVGQYTVQHITLAGQGTVAGGGVDTAKTHEWLTLGVRGRFDL
jgi:hypothetical protein